MLSEHGVHQPLISCTGVLQTKRHDIVAVEAFVGGEGGAFLVAGVHFDLIVSGEGIHHAEEFVSGGCIDQLIDTR
ncbi:hypothetical protein RchiOBHm_Chr2g0125101 [Rosa chinensis]|uniref:Uncharacterized protein n=1 Tax=Rosa chinensis TaxID=74649 RepID=A0A2P6RTG4_ROSCH|nr:hypothetical protein RchiOBHm_Chr2g0125101 [Rosa chinensis]